MTQGSDPVRPAFEEQAEELFAPGGESSAWFVFHTRPRCEKKAAEACRELEIHHYLPLRWSSSRKNKRRHSFEVPLFPGYLFGRCDAGERLGVLRSGYLVRTIDVVDQGRLLDELYNVHLASTGGADLQLYPQLKRGRGVRVLRGPLAGVTGLVSERKGAFRLVLNVSILGAAVSAELDIDDVEPL